MNHRDELDPAPGGPRIDRAREMVEAHPALEARLHALEAKIARVAPVLAAVETVVKLRHPVAPEQSAFFLVRERYVEKGAGGIVLEARSPAAEEMVRKVQPGVGLVELRRFLDDGWPGGDLATALEMLEQAMGRYLAGPATGRGDLIPLSALGGSDG